jgi:hypothetical protein
MSGGSYDYVYNKIEAISIRPSTALRRAFQAHLRLVAKAMHDIEWVDSGDTSPGDEDAAIRACLVPGAELDQLIREAKSARDELDSAIRRAARTDRRRR